MNTSADITPYFLFDRLFENALFDSFAQEALQLYRKSKKHIVADGEITERGGTPKRKFRAVGGGPVQNAIYASQKLLSHLCDRTEMHIVPSGERGTYTFYAEENDYLDIHRDVDYCDLTLITCLHSTLPKNHAHGLLNLYCERSNESLASIYKDRFWGYQSVFLRPGQSILLQGGIVPHGVNPMQANHHRIISALCFKRIS
ncbi:hypothetical protein RQM65_05590 [Pricia sp. S334]|uniref:Fe2OG dioxygenase domain-containing protein n=1 Tax=Pricia mediterranea TaxID=3076079 RepID=A0ABU3L3X4_9FLAO|nr:hypothetical protein [Pricia sp. S334]MDT7828137.1 hypothetical protein [Pricia sp. S334]